MTEITMVAHMFTAVVIILTTVLVLIFRAVFSPPSNDRSQDSSEHRGPPVPNTSSSAIESSAIESPAIESSAIESPAIESSAIESSSPRCWRYDVFLSFRGEDVRKNFVDHLYNALVERTVLTYKDDETLPRGDTIGPALLKAIQESRIALIVFSKNYADSSWCLDELAFIMKCKEERGQIAIPIFYDVDPSDVRKQKGQFGQAFSKHFSTNNEKVESWKEALVDSSNIAGWETKFVANGHEAKCIKEIVGSILDKLRSLNSAVDDDDELVGMVTRLQDLKSQLQIGSGGVQMVGIWGVGGGGKTTLATSLYLKISANFNSCCFVDNVREESRQQNGLKKLQGKILSTVLEKEIQVESVAIGKKDIKHMLCSRNVLVVLDDVDALEQLEALAGGHNWFGDGSRIIITTRDEHVLSAHRVDKVCPVSLLSHDEAIRLFRKHAYHEDNPVEDYEKLSLRVIKYVNGLPLALKIIGSFLSDKDKNEWLDTLDKLKETPNLKVTEQLKISYDGLDPDLKELFLDIACFFRGEREEKAMKILEACGFHPCIGVTVLKKKSLITISKYGVFDMHDLVQEMGHHIVRGKHPNNPEKHSRIWRHEDIRDLCSWNATTENHEIEALRYDISDEGPAEGFMTLVSNLKNLRYLHMYKYRDFLREILEYISLADMYNDYRHAYNYFPESFQPRKLVVLKLKNTLQEELWKGKKSMPCLKELELTYMEALVRTPDISGLSCLQNLIIKECYSLEEIHQSLGDHTSLVNLHVESCKNLASFPTIVRMEKLEILRISRCKALLEIPQSNKVSVHQNLPCLKELELTQVDALVRTPDFGGLPCLQKVTFDGCRSLKEIHPSIGSHSSLVDISVAYCPMLTRFPTIVRMEKLEMFDISNCRALLEFPKIKANMDSLENLHLVDLEIEVLPSSVGRYCTNLIRLTLFHCSKLKTIEGNFHALKRLEKFELYGGTQLEKFPKDLFDAKCCLEELRFRVPDGLNIFQPSPPHLPHLLRKLGLGWCKLKDGEIPCEIGGLSSLIELYLDYNHFSRVDINLSQLTQLKLLSLNYCEMLVELPELPPNLAILQAENCNSLKAIREDIYSNCKWLCSFSVRSDWDECRGNFFGGKRLLESMLQGNAVENHQCMSLILRGVEVLKKFEPGWLRGRRFSLQLPENWFNEYTGFLFCSVFKNGVPDHYSLAITMEHVSFDDERVFYEEDESVDDEQVSWKELYKKGRKNTNTHTWVVYVSFGSLKSTAWWDQPSTALYFSVNTLNIKSIISGFGVRLVSKKNQMKETKTTKNSSSEFSDDDGDYKYKFQIRRDSKSELQCRFDSFDDSFDDSSDKLCNKVTIIVDDCGDERSRRKTRNERSEPIKRRRGRKLL